MFRVSFVLFIIYTTAKAIPTIKTPNFSPTGRIVGGTPATIEDHPWQASLQVLGFHFCGGSIITDLFILTAGHCATSYQANWISVRVGTSKLMEGGIVHRVNETILNEHYKVNEYNIPVNDIAVLRLRTSIVFSSSVKPIRLFNQDEIAKDGTLSTISGWGATIEGGKLPEVLYSVDVPIISKDECGKAYTSYGGIPDGQICAAYPDGGKDSCQGDSGGPMVIGGRQAGIVSWGNGCAREGYPGVYSEIASFNNWIVEHTNM